MQVGMVWLADREVGIIGGWVGTLRRKKRYEGKVGGGGGR